MKILVAHNAYQQRGGEDSVVDDEVALLRARGAEVELFHASNDDIGGMGRLELLGRTLWSQPAAAEMRRLCERFCPDVVHVHNSFPLLSPSIHWAAQEAGVPVVQTLHNFRLVCPQAMLLREGRVCEDCVGRVPWRGAARGCYRGSVAQSSVLAGMLTLHRAKGTWQRRVNRFIVLNEAYRSRFVAAGFPAERFVVKQNFVDLPEPQDTSRAGLLAVGRLSEEKGWPTIAQASALSGVPIDVVGRGPLEEVLRASAGLTLHGALPLQEVYARMCSASAQVVASVWLEGGPRTLIEGMACGLPAICSAMEPMMEIVQDGVTGLAFPPGDAQALAQRLTWAQEHPEAMLTMGRAARQVYEARYTADRNHAQLMSIYQSAIEEGPRRD